MASSRALFGLLLSGLVLGGRPAPVTAQEAPTGVMVLPFEDGGSYGQDKDNFLALRLGIPALLRDELAGSNGVRLIDPTRAAQLLAAEDLGEHGRVDAGTAARLGQAAGARYVVLGTFTDYFGRFRIDARIVDARSGEILKVVRNDDPAQQDRRDLSAIIRLIGDKVLRAVGLPPLAPAGARQIPTDALTAYSRGLLDLQRGDSTAAVGHFQRALQAAPDFPAARQELDRLRP